MIISHSILLRMKNVSDKIVERKKNAWFDFNNFPSPKNRAIYEIMWENIVERGKSQMTI